MLFSLQNNSGSLKKNGNTGQTQSNIRGSGVGDGDAGEYALACGYRYAIVGDGDPGC